MHKFNNLKGVFIMLLIFLLTVSRLRDDTLFREWGKVPPPPPEETQQGNF